MLTQRVTVSFWSVLVPAVAAMALFGGIVVFAVGRSMRRRPAAGVEELIGSVGTAATPLDPAGKIFIRGEYWSVLADADVQEGGRVEVVSVEGLKLRVRSVS